MPTTIVVSDDEDALRTVLCQELATRGYRGVPCEDKRRAYDWIIRDQPDLIISDIKSPGMNGFEFLQWLKANPLTRHIPFIFVTAYADLKNAIASKRMGAEDFVSKPYMIEDLLATVQRVLTGTCSDKPKALEGTTLEPTDVIMFRPWVEVTQGVRNSIRNSGIRVGQLPRRVPWSADYVVDSNGDLCVCRVVRPNSIHGISVEELLSFRSYLDELEISFGFILSVCEGSTDIDQFAALHKIVLLGPEETLEAFQSGTKGHRSATFAGIADGTLLLAWQKKHNNLRKFAKQVFTGIVKSLKRPLCCSFIQNGSSTSTVISINEVIVKKGIVLRGIESDLVVKITTTTILQAILGLWQQGRVKLVSTDRRLGEVALYSVLASDPTLEGDGTTIYLPDAQPEQSNVPREKPIVALLDDERAMLEGVAGDLRAIGFDVMTFEYKDEFLCHIKHNPAAVPDLVVSDLYSPRMDGLQFLRAFRLNPTWRKIPVLVLSGGVPALKKEAHRNGAYRCLAKPYDGKKLIPLIKHISHKYGFEPKLAPPPRA